MTDTNPAAAELNLTTLPGRAEMLERLKGVSDEPHAVEKFYPLILKAAGHEKTGIGVVMLVQLAIADYTAGLIPAMARVMYMRLGQYVAALIDDEEVRAEALQIVAELAR